MALVGLSLVSFAQTNLDKTFPVQKGGQLVLLFDYPELVKVHTWDKQEVRITGTVSINRGENDNAFELRTSTDGNETTIASMIKNKDSLPQHIVIKKDDQEFFFKAKDWNDPEIRKFLDEHGREYTYMSNGVIMDITLEIYVPQNMTTRIEAKYGMVEVKDFHAPLTVDAQYGGVDATISAINTGELTARTRFGEILSNLDVKFNPWKEGGHESWTEISALLGKGPAYRLQSKFGKVYLRKAL